MFTRTTANLPFSSISQLYEDALVRWWDKKKTTPKPQQATIKSIFHKHYLLIYNWKSQLLMMSTLFLLDRKHSTSSVCHSSKPTWLHGLFYPNSSHCLQEPSLDALCWRERVARAVGRLCKHPCFSNHLCFLWFAQEGFSAILHWSAKKLIRIIFPWMGIVKSSLVMKSHMYVCQERAYIIQLFLIWTVSKVLESGIIH